MKRESSQNWTCHGNQSIMIHSVIERYNASLASAIECLEPPLDMSVVMHYDDWLFQSSILHFSSADTLKPMNETHECFIYM